MDRSEGHAKHRYVEAHIESPGRQLYIDKTESIMLSDKSRARSEVMLASAVRERG